MMPDRSELSSAVEAVTTTRLVARAGRLAVENVWPIVVVTFPLVCIGCFVSASIDSVVEPWIESVQDGMVRAHRAGEYLWALKFQQLARAVFSVPGLVVYGVAVAAAIAAYAGASAGRPVGATTAWRHVFARARRILPIVAYVAIGWAFGSMLLLVPGLVFMGAFGLSLPAATLEESSVRGALARSRALSKDRVLRVGSAFLYMLLFGLLCILVCSIPVMLVYSRVNAGEIPGADETPAEYVMGIMSRLVATELFVLLTGALATVAFLDLRQAREGAPVTTGAVAQVFE